MLKLTREIRFGLQPEENTSLTNFANGFAANPALTSIAPFLTLAATLSGNIDPANGMLINIKIVDRTLREFAIPILRSANSHEQKSPAAILPVLLKILPAHFTPHVLESLTLLLSPYLSFSTHKENPHMVQLSLRFEFSAAHRLHSDTLSEKENTDIFGRCNNPNGHGHNYELEVTLAGQPNPNTGEILPIPLLQKIVNETVLDHFDHKHLNLDCPEFRTFTGGAGLNPTVENIAAVIFKKLKPAIPAPASLHHIRIWETPKTFAEYSE